MKKEKMSCKHDYKNAVKVGNIDYQCPLCDKLLDPNEWFFMNYFEFVDVDMQKEDKIKNQKSKRKDKTLLNQDTKRKINS